MRCQLWRIAFPIIAFFAALPVSQAQTATYHLHKEASTINTSFDQLKTAGPDASSITLTKALANQPAGDYLIKEFETQTGVPNAPGIIPASSTMSFSLFMRKTANVSGVTVKPEAKLRLNNATGTSLCSVIGSTALTTTVTKMTFTCTTPTGTGITMTASDRFYLWVGVNISARSTSTYSGELDIEGTLNGNFDSTITIKVPSAGLTPTSLSFANQIVNTTSAAQGVTLKNNQTTSLTISGIATSGDYAQTNNCGSSLAAGASCTINVTFRPTATGLRTGTLTVTDNGNDSPQTASLSGTGIALSSIAVTPANPSVPKGLTQQFTATGTYTDGSQQNLTNTVTWASSQTAFATINSTGLATTVAQGNTTISATSGSVTGSTTLTVAPPALTSIAVTPANPSVPKGLTQQFTATGTYTDNSQQNLTNSVTWASSQTAIATINSTGLATTVAQGSTTISATSGSVVGSTTLTVSAPALVSIAVTPTNPTIIQNATQQFTATGTYTDTSTQNLTGSATWSSSSTGVATINSSGLATGLTPGSSTITALSGSISGTTTLTVVSNSIPTISGISPSPAAVGGTVTINGFNFGSTQGFSVVTFNGISAALCSPTPSCWSDTSISIKVPVGATTGNVLVNVKGVYSNGVNLTIVPPPLIVGVTPSWIPVGGALTISGSGFGSSGTVTINGTTASITNWSGTAVSVTVPTSVSPSVNTQVVVTADGLASQPFTFITHPAPAISAQPGGVCLSNGTPPEFPITNCVMQGAIGAQVSIIGNNLGQLQGDSTVSFGGVQATQIQQEGSRFIVATIPSGITPPPPTTVNVVVNVDGVASAPGSFTVTASPVINNLSVTSGGEGSSVTINGSNFGSSGTVSFGGTVATVQSGNWGTSQITTTVPAGASSGPVVVNANGVPSNGINFTIPPSITSPLNPSSGPVSSSVVISGAGFGSPQGSSTLTFSGTTAKITTWSTNSITAVVPSIAVGPATVAVTVGGQSATGSFTVTAGPSISSLSSSSGATGSLVGINGANFGSLQGSSVVRFNGAAAQVCTTNCAASGCAANGWSDSCIPTYVPSNATTGPVTVTVVGLAATGPQFTVTGPGTGQISGTVTCGSGTVTVQALRQGVAQGSTTTACNGSYSISNLAADSYDVQASAAGYGTATQNAIAVTVGGNTSGINFSLSTAGTITGQITQVSGGAAINGAIVQVFAGSALVGSVNTGGGNTYTFNNLNAASYRVQASATGFVDQSQNVSVGSGGTVTQNFALQGPGSTPITYSYDNLGRLIGVTDQSGDTATYNYDAVGNITSIGRRSSSQVSLISIAPPSAHVGDTVTLTGTGFSSTPSQNTVQFTGGTAVASSSSATQVVATVPAGASTGAVAVNVSGTVSNTVPFTVLASAGAPMITNVNPLIGLSGTSFAVTGTNFDSAISNDLLALNTTSLAISPTGYSSTNINTSVPTSATSGHVSIITPGGAAVGSQDFIVPPPGFQASDVAYSARTSFPSAGSVSIGNIPSVKIGMVLFDAVGGQKVNIQVNSTTFTGCELKIYAPNNGTTPIYDQGQNPNCSSTGFTSGGIVLPVTGTYTIVFYNFGASTSTLSFTLYDATDFTATIGYGQTVTAPLSTLGQNGRLTFLAIARQHVSVKVLGGLGSGCSLTLLGPANQSLIQFSAGPPYHFTPTGDCSTTNNFWDIGYLPSLTGVYTIVITPSSGATLPASVTLQLLDSTDNVPSAITNVTTSGTPVTVSTSIAGQNIQQVFSGTAGQKISLKVTALDNLLGHTDVWILGPGNVSVAHATAGVIGGLPYFFDPRQSPNSQNSVAILPATGNYTILIDPNDASINGTGSTSFTLYLASDVTASTLDATSLPFGNSINTTSPTSAQAAPGQTVTFPFVANLGQSLAFEVDEVTTPPQVGCSFTIYDPNNQPLATTFGINYQNVACTSGGVASDLPDPLPATGTYTVVLMPAMNTGAPYNTGSFKLTLTNTQDNVYTITPTPSGAQLTVSNTVPRQNDVITFQGTAGQIITLFINSMQYDPPPRNSFTPNLVISGPAGPSSQQLAAAYAGSTFQAGQTIGPITLPANGTYTIFVTPGGYSGTATGSMTFTLTSQ